MALKETKSRKEPPAGLASVERVYIRLPTIYRQERPTVGMGTRLGLIRLAL